MSKLIAGPTVFICDECVELCHDIVGLKPVPSPLTGEHHLLFTGPVTLQRLITIAGSVPSETLDLGPSLDRIAQVTYLTSKIMDACVAAFGGEITESELIRSIALWHAERVT